MIRMWLSLTLVLALSACASAPERDFHYLSAELASIWPEPPALPRYRFVGLLTGEPNYPLREAEGNLFGKLLGLNDPEDSRLLLQRPQSGYTDDNGDIYVTDPGSQAVFVFRHTPAALEQWQDAAEGLRFQSPVAITRGYGGQLFITDADRAQVFVFDHSGLPLGSFGGKVLQRPTGISYDPQQRRLYVADTQAHNIKVFDEENQLLQTIGQRGDGPGQFNFPTHLHFSQGHLLLTDAMNARVQVLDAEGRYLDSFGNRGLYIGDTPHPKGVTADSDGNIYVIESYYDHLLVYSRDGDFLLPLSGEGKGFGKFYLPAGVWADDNNRIYIADMFNGRIVVLQYLGES
jgi:DNA-binding beta-propeller fold protein YncE